jgi:hypothetical protein
MNGKTREKKRYLKLDQRPKAQQREQPIQSNTETKITQRSKAQQREQPIQSSTDTQIAQRPKAQQREQQIQSNTETQIAQRPKALQREKQIQSNTETQIAQRPKALQREQQIQSNTETQIAQRPKAQQREQQIQSDFDKTPTPPTTKPQLPVIDKPVKERPSNTGTLDTIPEQEERSAQPSREEESPQQNEKIPTPSTTEKIPVIDILLPKEKPALDTAKNEANIKTPKLSETDLQALETAKRVAGNFYEEIDKKFDKIEEYNSICQEILKRLQNTPRVEAGTEADKLKKNIGRQTISLLTMRDTVLIERNKAKEFKEKVEADYSNQNLRNAKANTDSVKKIRKSIMGDEKSNGYLQRIEAIRNQVDDYSESFFDMIEDKSLNLDRIFDEAIVIRDILRNGYQQILVY